MKDLPHALDYVRYRTTRGTGDYTGYMVVHIDTNSRFKGEKIKNLDRRHWRKIETLFLLSNTRTRMKFTFD